MCERPSRLACSNTFWNITLICYSRELRQLQDQTFGLQKLHLNVGNSAKRKSRCVRQGLIACAPTFARGVPSFLVQLCLKLLRELEFEVSAFHRALPFRAVGTS